MKTLWVPRTALPVIARTLFQGEILFVKNKLSILEWINNYSISYGPVQIIDSCSHGDVIPWLRGSVDRDHKRDFIQDLRDRQIIIAPIRKNARRAKQPGRRHR